MTKAEIIAEISSKTGIEKVDVQETVEAFFKVVKTSMVVAKTCTLEVSVVLL
jgi:DNA-binding protein HU-beta